MNIKNILSLIGILFICLINGYFTGMIFCKILSGICELKLLPWSFCGDYTGMLNITFTGILLSFLFQIIIGYFLYSMSKKYNGEK